MKTPFHKIIFLIGLLTGLVFISANYIIQKKNQFLKSGYEQLEKEGIKTFSTIDDYQVSGDSNNKKHVYTYLLTDPKGDLHEINEFVDEKTYLRLRVGNSIVTKFIMLKFLNQEIILSRIEGNNQNLPNLNLIENFSNLGIIFSALLILLSGINFVASLNFFKLKNKED